MTPDFNGTVQPRLQSETHPPDNSTVLDKGCLRAFAQAHEEGGFDRVLIGYHADAPDGMLLASFIASPQRRDA